MSKMPDTDSAAQAVPTRDLIPLNDTWDLTLLYETPSAWEDALERYKKAYPRYSEFRGTLGRSPEALLKFLEFDRSLDLDLERLFHYANLQTSEDASNAEYLARESRLANTATRAAEAASWFTPELQSLDDATFQAFLASPILAEWVVRLRKIRRFKPHTLSEGEERLMALGATALAGHGDTFSQLTNVDMRFGHLEDEHGRRVELSHASFLSFLQKSDAQLRETAFRQYYREFTDHRFTIASTLASSVRADVFNARARNFASAREAALFPDSVPTAVYDNLIAAVRANLDPLFEYFEIRRRALNLAEIHHYDTYVPLVEEVRKETNFDHAAQLVCESLAPLGAEYVSSLQQGFASRWVDRYETRGKRSGAFSSSSYGNPPYILMNYKADVFADIYTLAHEAGHSMHSWYSMRSQPFQDYQYPIFLAEVASTLNEELLTHHLLAQTDDPRMRAFIINRQIDDIRGTVYRQTMFAEFERVIHDIEEAGEPLTLETMQAEYRKLLEAYFGPRFVLDDELSLECLRIPHFYSAFYVYKYATGIAAASSLAAQILGLHSAPAKQRYANFLASGGSRYPIETLREAGVDMESPEPVNAALAVFARRVRELKELLAI